MFSATLSVFERDPCMLDVAGCHYPYSHRCFLDRGRRSTSERLTLLHFKLDTSAPGSWRDPAGGSPVQVRGSARLVASVALWKVTTMAKRTQRLCGVGY